MYLLGLVKLNIIDVSSDLGEYTTYTHTYSAIEQPI